jgi:hypothetical protein
MVGSSGFSLNFAPVGTYSSSIDQHLGVFHTWTCRHNRLL